MLLNIYLSMTLKIYNTASRKKEVFKPIKEKEVSMYCCGPTLYWYQHIGNLRTYISEDILKRVLEKNGYKVKHIVNLTDVGHLTSDSDEGEDKLVKALKREGLPLTYDSMLKLSEKYFRAFENDLKFLNIHMPNKWPRATDHISDMIALIKRIEKKGYTYKTQIGLIFDTSKFKNYAKFAKLNLEELKEGARGQEDLERKNPSDFALWITNQPNHVMLWDSPWNKGFPGWHLECSAMSIKYLGEHFDIHCGGKEHIQIHHTNEIAQSEAATGKKWVNYWIHTDWLISKEGKMSKSKGKFIRIKNLIEKGYDPIDYRYLTLTAKYNSKLVFDWKALDAAKTAFTRLKNKIIEFKNEKKSLNPKNKEKYSKEFYKFVNDDLNIPKALAILWDVVKSKDIGSKEKLELLYDFDEILGLNLKKVKEEKIKLPKEIKELVDKREKSRKEKDWKTADTLRKELKEKGYEIKDTPKGPKLSKVNS